MGCDIHPYVEYRDKDGNWQPADHWVQDGRYGDEQAWRVPYHAGLNRERHYNWFAFLADVRNGTWGEAIPVLAEAKGLPDDCCERIRMQATEWDGDGHSHSWFTLGELEAGWEEMQNERIVFRGAVDIREPHDDGMTKWLNTAPEKRGAPPNGFCAWGTHCTTQEWVDVLEKLIGEVYRNWHEYLWNVGFEFNVKDRDNDVRVVFWFDN